MRFKLLALALVATAAACAGTIVVRDRGVVAPDAAAQAIVLLPQTLNGYALQQRWHNSRPDDVIEEGALYAATAQPMPGEGVATEGVQLDFFRNARRAHSAALCNVRKGERLRSETLRTLKTRTGTAAFNLAFLSTDQELRLVAGTQCSNQRCVEMPSMVSAPWDSWNWKSITAPAAEAVVPTAIVLVRRHITSEQGMASAQQQMVDEFERDVADLDLLPAQRLAAALDKVARM